MRQQYTRNRRKATNTRPASLQLATQGITPSVSASRPALDAMTPDELRPWIGNMRAWLERKMARERAYLDRRAGRGTSTPTDEAYEEDQVHEADVLAMLTEARAGRLTQTGLKEGAI